ncbi:MAG TPA: hypothetical protein VKE40_13765, partial [Gemmataceae bacterium]|nr:hypothetical protein [Gemmataceae bacterium]
MSGLGKALIILNLLAAGAFAYFTLENWKVRQELSYAALSREVSLRGIPLDSPEKPPAGLDKDNVAFVFVGPGDRRTETLAKDKLNKLIPRGDELHGGEAVADQTAEVKRLQAKVLGAIPPAAQDPMPRFNALRRHLLNLAWTGADRDGANALFDLRDRSKGYLARRDLPYLARTASQVAALKTLVDIAEMGDPQAVADPGVRAGMIAAAKESVKRFVLGEVEGASATEEGRAAKNALADILQGKGQQGAVQGEFAPLADLAAQPLDGRPAIANATAAIDKYVKSKALTPAETAVLGDVVTLINPPAAGFNLDATIDTAGTNRLTQHFEEAAQPAKAAGNSAEGKARRIAHLLYHIDAHRYNQPPAAADRKAWHERVALIVGLPEYVRTAEAAASEYAEAAQRLVAAITEEQSTFEAEYQTQVQRVQFLFSQWLALDTQFKAQDKLTQENERLRTERETERNKLREELQKAQQNAKEAVEKLKGAQGRLFNIQKDLRNAQDAILSL